MLSPEWRFIFGVFGVSFSVAFGLLLISLGLDWSIVAGWTVLGIDALIVGRFLYTEKRAARLWRKGTPRSVPIEGTSMSDVEKAKALLAIVQEVYNGGRQVIGPGWTVLEKMTVLANANDVTGMVRYFENCKRSVKGNRVRRKLERAGKKSLESEEARFMTIARDP